MPNVLSAAPIGTSDPSDIYDFIPSSYAYPPLFPTDTGYYDELLSAAPMALLAGTYPGATTYPGSDVYPGRGSSLVASGVTPRVLTEVPA